MQNSRETVGLQKFLKLLEFLQGLGFSDHWEDGIADSEAGFQQACLILSREFSVPFDTLYKRGSKNA